MPKAGIAVPCAHCGATIDRDALVVGLYFADVSLGDISRALGISTKTVKQITKRWIARKSKRSVASAPPEA